MMLNLYRNLLVGLLTKYKIFTECSQLEQWRKKSGANQFAL